MNNDSRLLRDATAIIWRSRVLIVMYAAFVFLCALGILIYGPRTYESESGVYLRIGKESVGLDPTATVNETVTVQNNRRAEIQTAMDILLSRGIQESVVDCVGEQVILGNEPVPSSSPDKGSTVSSTEGGSFDLIGWTIGPLIGAIKSVDPVTARDEALEELAKSLSVDSSIESSVIKVAYRAETPELAQLVVRKLMDQFRIEHVRLNRTSGSGEFFASQVKELQENVQRAAEQLTKQKNDLDLNSIGQREATLEKQYALLKQELATKRAELENAIAMRSALAERMQGEPERMKSADVAAPNTGADLIRQQLYSLRVQQLASVSNLTKDHPRRKAIEQQYEEARQAAQREPTVRQQTTEDVNRVREELRLAVHQQGAKILGIEAHIERLKAELADVVESQESLNLQESKIEELELEYSQAINSLASYRSRLEETRYDEALQKQNVSNANVIHDASFNPDPVSPNKMIVVLAAIMLAGGGSVCIAFLRDQFDNRVLSAHNLQRDANVTILASVPKYCNIKGDVLQTVAVSTFQQAEDPSQVVITPRQHG